jgi:LuxR family transcriptional regulator, maltose regulon positive regulatory protein
LRHFGLTSATPVQAEHLLEAHAPTPVPTLHRRHTRRPRLTRILDASPAQAILVTAPAGYGKTSLACEWLAGRSKIAWYTATPASADLAAFSVGVADVVASLVPGAGARLRQRLRVAEAPEKAVRPLAELLAEDLAEWPDSGLLVIDDYHLVIDSAPVEEFMDWLLTLAPIRVLVTTRRRPSWASARRVLYGEVSEITKEQLAMTNEEAARVLDGRPSEAVRALVAQAQGWPALIGLAALSATAEVPSERMSEGLFRYFAEEVFRREPEEIQRFMLLASVPHSVNAEIAREVLEVEHADEKLDWLLQEGLLQKSVQHDLAFHPLLRSFLSHKLESAFPTLAGEVISKVVAHARRAQRWEEAFDLAIKQGALDEASAIIGDASRALLATGRVETIEKWLTACGSATLRHHEASLAKIELLIRQGRLSEALVLANEIIARLPSGDRCASRAWCLAGHAAHFLCRDHEALRCHLKARELAACQEDRRNALWGAVLTAAELELDDMDCHLAALNNASPDDIDSRLRVANGRTITARAKGSLAGVADHLKSLLPFAEHASDPMIKSSFYAHLAYVHVLNAQYSKARDLALLARDSCRQYRLTFGEALCELVRAHAEIGLRHLSEAQRIIRIVETRGTALEDPFIGAVIPTLHFRLALLRGAHHVQLDTIPRPTAPLRSLRGELQSLIALAAAAIGEVERAKEHVELARSSTTSVEAFFLCRFSEIVIMMRTEEEEHSLLEEATAALQDAVDAGARDTFVTAYRAYPNLLRLLSQADTVASAVNETMILANDGPMRSEVGLEVRTNPGLEQFGNLTRRELEVLELMQEGLSNADIAKRLVVAESTVKVHVRNILRKFGAKNRLQAVLVAQARHLAWE